jgi:hypothetical protein
MQATYFLIIFEFSEKQAGTLFLVFGMSNSYAWLQPDTFGLFNRKIVKLFGQALSVRRSLSLAWGNGRDQYIMGGLESIAGVVFRLFTAWLCGILSELLAGTGFTYQVSGIA